MHRWAERVAICRALQLANGRSYYIISGGANQSDQIYDDAGQFMPLEMLVLLPGNPNIVQTAPAQAQITITEYLFDTPLLQPQPLSPRGPF